MKPWYQHVEDEDFQFIKRFILASGSLKDLATVYGVSYPTIRLRLDRLIEKLKILDDTAGEDGFVKALRVQYADGKIDKSTFDTLLSAYEEVRDRKV